MFLNASVCTVPAHKSIADVLFFLGVESCGDSGTLWYSEASKESFSSDSSSSESGVGSSDKWQDGGEVVRSAGAARVTTALQGFYFAGVGFHVDSADGAYAVIATVRDIFPAHGFNITQFDTTVQLRHARNRSKSVFEERLLTASPATASHSQPPSAKDPDLTLSETSC